MTTLLRVLVIAALVLAAAPRPPKETTTGPGKETKTRPLRETTTGKRETTTGNVDMTTGKRETTTGKRETTTGNIDMTTGKRETKTTGPGPAVAQRMRLFKTEVIKSRILSEVNLKEPPVVSSPLTIPDNVIHLLESKEVEEAILSEGENLIAYPLEGELFMPCSYSLLFSYHM